MAVDNIAEQIKATDMMRYIFEIAKRKAYDYPVSVRMVHDNIEIQGPKHHVKILIKLIWREI